MSQVPNHTLNVGFVPQSAIDIELCPRITRQTTTLPLLKRIIVVVPQFLPREKLVV